MRISGLATGMDTESIIRDLMKAQRIPLDKITHKKQKLEWQLEDYRSINRNLKTMEYSLRDTTNKQASYIAKTVNVSNSDAVGVKSINSTSDFSGTIAVHQLATNSTWQSGEITIPADKTENSTLADLGITGNMIAIKSGKETVEVKLDGTDTLSSLVDKINKEANVNAFFDSKSGKLAFSAKDGGSDNNIVVGGDMKIGEAVVGGASTEAKDADFTFNGLRTSRSTNTFQINGFEFNIKQVTSPYINPPVDPLLDPPAVETSGAVTFNSTADVDKVMETVVKFVDDYNKMIEELNKKIREPVNRSFHPLSDEQKKDMKEKEIELWEEKAKSGALKNDPAISSMLTKLRHIMSGALETSTGKASLKDLGITATRDYLSHGKLEIDETKLREEIAKDPNKVYELIGKPNDDPKKAGLSHQYRIEIEKTQKVIAERAGSAGAVNDTFTLGKNLKDMNSQIDKFENRLQMVESRYWKQFNAMESAIQRMNAQSAQLMSQFGG